MFTSFMVRGEKLPEVSLTFKAIIQYIHGPLWVRWGATRERHRDPLPDPSQRQTCTTPEAGSGHGLPYGIGRGNVLESGDEFGPLEKTGAQTHKNRQDPAESEGRGIE